MYLGEVAPFALLGVAVICLVIEWYQSANKEEKKSDPEVKAIVASVREALRVAARRANKK